MNVPLELHDRLQAEYKALNRGALLFPPADPFWIELTGRDRASFLHNFCTNDIKKLAAGSGCEAFLTNIKGRILEHLFVFAGDSALWISGTPGREATVAEHLERYLITEDVEIHRRSHDWTTLRLAGAKAGSIVERHAGQGSSEWKNLQHARGVVEGADVLIARQDIGAVPSWIVVAPKDHAEQLHEVFLRDGAQAGDPGIWDALRIQAGWPLCGVDITEDNLAQEARRTPVAISFTKGCYLGQEPIARLDALGHVNRELCVVETRDSGAPHPGSLDVTDESGVPMGLITSTAWHPGTQSSWGLAVLKTAVSREGTAVRIGKDGVPGLVHAPVLPPAP